MDKQHGQYFCLTKASAKWLSFVIKVVCTYVKCLIFSLAKVESRWQFHTSPKYCMYALKSKTLLCILFPKKRIVVKWRNNKVGEGIYIRSFTKCGIKHTPYSWNIMWQKSEGNCGLWVLNEIIIKKHAESLKKIVGAVWELPAK